MRWRFASVGIVGVVAVLGTSSHAKAQYASVRVVDRQFDGAESGRLPRLDEHGRSVWRDSSSGEWRLHDGSSTTTLQPPPGANTTSLTLSWTHGGHLLARGSTDSGPNTWKLGAGQEWLSLDRRVHDINSRGDQIGEGVGRRPTVWLGGSDPVELPSPSSLTNPGLASAGITNSGLAGGMLFGGPPIDGRLAAWTVAPPVLTEFPASSNSTLNINQRFHDINEAGQMVGIRAFDDPHGQPTMGAFFFDPVEGFTDLPSPLSSLDLRVNDLGTVCLYTGEATGARSWNIDSGFTRLWDLLSPEDQGRYSLRDTYDINNRGEVLLYAVDHLLDESQLVIVTIPGPSTMALAALGAVAGLRRRRVATSPRRQRVTVGV
ncbi:MAG: hypothetical protein GIKADHBN_00241 [Phycisphaerales bacterium]|nr:hypothetical protein [Phycisphaerales bacterium]